MVLYMKFVFLFPCPVTTYVYEINLSKLVSLVSYATLAASNVDRQGLSNEVCHEFLEKKSKVMLYHYSFNSNRAPFPL